MRVLMVCSGGMSSAIVVKALKQEAEKQGLEMEIKAVGTSEFSEEVGRDYNYALVAPQVKHRYNEYKKAADQANVPCEMIPPRGYTPIGAPSLIKQIKEGAK
ncbi:PTS system, cellobiose-specific IIB component [Amphibacillus marinus]|uniref:PTS system, cellobiose-specific IIB component n=1 Tax=Amphibacillus marinus TaxID=872970 RepID=A0A1H8QR58_9BACI|nr:PTS sugar transporter subunit IIB [Amphibacillus marinus]SEO56526.1 PTS system, cellobiose-specific IIB component [Amphibacillus marinus]